MSVIGAIGLAAQGAKALWGLGSGIAGAVKQKRLWKSRPELGVTEGETANDALYKQMASVTELPGQRRAEERLGEIYATGVSDAQRTANSSLAATQSAIDLAGKKMSAIKDLAGSFAEYKAQRMDALGRWNDQKTNLELQRFDVNKLQPWGTKMNEAVGQKQSGFQAFGSSIDSGLGMLTDMAGTNQYLEVLKSLYPNLGGSITPSTTQSNQSPAPSTPMAEQGTYAWQMQGRNLNNY